MESAAFFRVYVPYKVAPIIQDLYDEQAGSYIVQVPCFAGDQRATRPDDTHYCCRAVVDDFGNLRSVA